MKTLKKIVVLALVAAIFTLICVLKKDDCCKEAAKNEDEFEITKEIPAAEIDLSSAFKEGATASSTESKE